MGPVAGLQEGQAKAPFFFFFKHSEWMELLFPKRCF